MSFWAVFFMFLVSSTAFSAVERQPCGTLSEPSGVVQLLDGRLLVVEDEKHTPLRLLSSKGKPLALSADSVLGKLADLEAVAMDNNGFIYAITSHSRTHDGKRSDAREKLVRFTIEGQTVHHVVEINTLRKEMGKLSHTLKAALKIRDVKQDSGFNIEGLSFDQHKRHLLIGLRSPVVKKKAVVLVLKNPKTLFDKHERPDFKKSPIYLDLDNGGIRSITFDPYLKGYLIVSRHEKKGKKFKLWWWSGQKSQAPRRVHINGKFDLSNAEGITSVRGKGGRKLMIVFDVGNSSKRHKGCYAFIDYSQLKIEGGVP